jgi:hypothetical protein
MPIITLSSSGASSRDFPLCGLNQWLKIKEVDTAHACMEATGGYGASR